MLSMKGWIVLLITLEVGHPERRAQVEIRQEEIADVHLHVAEPEKRNRSGLYMRRHRVPGREMVSPNCPLRDANEPFKLSIPDHIKALRQQGLLRSTAATRSTGGMTSGSEPSQLAVPVSDIVANLMRPAFHRDGLGDRRLFFLEDEPIEKLRYWCVCLFRSQDRASLQMRWARFDPTLDRIYGAAGEDIMEQGLVWAVALVPLVVDAAPLATTKIAQYDYDLRQIFGRDAEKAIRYAYDGLSNGSWNARVAELVAEHELHDHPYPPFYHSVLALNHKGHVIILQSESTLPDLARRLAEDGMVAAGLLDSGGSCALYDPWLESYLNHSWYFRESRGAILVFELTSMQRLPQSRPGAWIQRRRSV